MGMINVKDALLSFGSCLLASGTAFDKTISLNKAQTERMKVEVTVKTAAAGGTDATFTLKGCDTENGTYTAVSTATATTAKMTAGASFTLPIPDGVNFAFYKVEVSKSGTFTAGELEANLDTYLGI